MNQLAPDNVLAYWEELRGARETEARVLATLTHLRRRGWPGRWAVPMLVTMKGWD